MMKALLTLLSFLVILTSSSKITLKPKQLFFERENYCQDIDTLKDSDIKFQDSIGWNISCSLKNHWIYSEITNILDQPALLRLASSTVPESGSIIDVYVFDGTQWKYYETGNLFLPSDALRTQFSPKETKNFCCGILTNDVLKGTVFIRYMLFYAVSPDTVLHQQKEIVHTISPPRNKEGEEEEPIYRKVDKAPQFPGGDTALTDFFKSKVGNSMKNKVSGTVKVIVEKDGSVRFPFVTLRNRFKFDENILPTFQQMPKWSPAYVEGKPVRAFHDIKINFN